MNTFEWNQSITDLFYADEELTELLGFNDASPDAIKIYQHEHPIDEFEMAHLPALAIHFDEAETTYNDFVNRGFLNVDIFVSKEDYELAGDIRKRIVTLMFDTYNEVCRGEGQAYSGIRDIFKYTMVYTPLVNSKG